MSVPLIKVKKGLSPFIFSQICLVLICSVISVRAATFTVTNVDDAGAGSLGQAILDAGAAAGNDEIVFDPIFFSTPRTINLLSQLSINGGGNLTINGPGANFLEIVSPLTAPTALPIHAFSISDTQLTFRKIKLRGMVVSNTAGAVIEEARFFGLGLVNQGITVVNNSAIENCGVRFDGGGVSNSGTLTINRSTISNNGARNGGGIANFNGSNGTVPSNLFINDSVMSGNQVMESGIPAPSGRGGAIYQQGGTITINRTLIKNNSATYVGGVFGSNGSINVYNSTITGNTGGGNSGTSSAYAAGINCPGQVSGRMINSTVIGNTGLDVMDTGGIFQIGNSIMGVFFGNFRSLGYNIIATNNAYMTGGVTTGNQLNVNPQVAALANNGGTTETRALLPTSPAINAGNNELANSAGLLSDQRGGCFRRIVGAAVDIGAFEVQATSSIVCGSRFDYDGDGKADLALFRPSNGGWYLLRSGNGSYFGTGFGQIGDIITPADFDGDGRTDIAVFRDGIWYWLNSLNGNFNAVQFGISSDIPVPADYTGDGRAELAVYRGGVWYTLNLANNQFQGVQFGIASDKPVPADYDGDGKADIAVVRQGGGVSAWYILGTSLGFYGLQFGTDTDKLVPADYDGDSKTDVAVYRNGFWYVLGSMQGFYGVQFGAASDIPVAADYDGDGKADIAVYRDGVWYMFRSQQGFGAVQFGTTNDRPIPAAFVP